MGKRLIQQCRGKGSLTYRVRPSAYKHKISYPALSVNGFGKIVKLINSAGHTAPLAKIEIMVEKAGKKEKINFIVPAADGVYEGQEIFIGLREKGKPEKGDIVALKDIIQGTKVFNVEIAPGKGGKILRTGGSSGIIMTRDEKGVELIIRRRKLKINKDSRAIIGVAAGEGRITKPLIKAGKKHHLMKSVGRKWHRTSAIKRNAVDHPFGSGRGKRAKSKIAKRNSPPGLKVGHIRPSRTGRKK